MHNLITINEEPKIDMIHKTTIEYTECLGNACKSIRIERRMLFCELIELVVKLINEYPQQEKGKGNDEE